ncbi:MULTISPECIES: DUF1569 domain-containing protein [Paenibacillus]|uniref:DUF1569 domain-containing protein n=1 Tax=Paenibacillus TaxID=44249 RepID=UPI0004083D85|nr:MULTISPECIES: DUF1569 domain-containing protein [Paenibacillus]KGP78170.1 hypothetical protein P364_0129970 [Paenibacillus sp. MAEPY2]KGP80820.1 hypothetical protein P363_0129510 [Paenibacillus sp. MAEPY1]OZQ68157.1 hypothetical protein CA599_16210 [Paenibacillus taichungensis]HBU84405.1 DUF1569 domain-containing protein [Paenibacillus sp.]
MNSIFDQNHTNEIIVRIKQLRPDSQPRWGKMNVAQMLAHCSSFQEIAMGNSSSSRSWLGLVIGKFVKPMVYNDKPLPKNMSTIPNIMIVDERDFDVEKETLIQNIITFQNNGPEKCTTRPHPFFGKLSPEEWGKCIYKHLDHHLKQFGV